MKHKYTLLSKAAAVATLALLAQTASAEVKQHGLPEGRLDENYRPLIVHESPQQEAPKNAEEAKQRMEREMQNVVRMPRRNAARVKSEDSRRFTHKLESKNTPSGLCTYEYDDNGNIVMEEYGGYRYTEYTYDEQNRMTQSVETEKEYDMVQSVRTQKYEYITVNGYETRFAIYNEYQKRQGDKLMPVNIEVWEYNEKGNSTYSRYAYFDENGVVSTEYVYSYPNGDYENYTELTYEYGELMSGGNRETTYSADSLQCVSIYSFYDRELKRWQFDNKNENTYNAQRQITARNEYVRNDSEWALNATYEYTYNAQGKLYQQTSYHYSDGERYLSSVYTYTYDGDNYEYTYEYWDGTQLCLGGKNKEVRTTTANGEKETLYYSWVNNEWVISYHYINDPLHFLNAYYRLVDKYEYTNLWDWDGMVGNYYYYAPDWNSIDDLSYSLDDNKIALSLPVATYSQWQAQFGVFVNLKQQLDPYKNHTIRASVETNIGTYVYISLTNNENNCTFAETRTWVEPGVTNLVVDGYAPNVDAGNSTEYRFILDFGGNQAGTDITISDIRIEEEGVGDYVTANMLYNLNETVYREDGKVIRSEYMNDGTYYYYHGYTSYDYNEYGDPTHRSYLWENETRDERGNIEYGYKTAENSTYSYTNLKGEKVMGAGDYYYAIDNVKIEGTYYEVRGYGSTYESYPYEQYENYTYSPIPFVIDGLKYKVDFDAKEAVMCGYKVAPGASLIVPAQVEVDGTILTVNRIERGEHSEDLDIRHVDLPATMKTIGYNAFDDCEIESIIMRATEVPEVEDYEPFSHPTYNHAVLYVPTQSWHAYAYDEGFYHFINIKKDAATVAAISELQAYTMLDSRSMNYVVYDPVNGNLKNIASATDIDESNPNHGWMVVNTEKGNYLYNLGAKKFAKVNENGAMSLVESAALNTIEQGTEGIVLGNNSQKQWNFIETNSLGIDEAVLGNLTSIGSICTNQPEGETYNFAGQRTNGLQSGFQIIRNANGSSHKVVR